MSNLQLRFLAAPLKGSNGLSTNWRSLYMRELTINETEEVSGGCYGGNYGNYGGGSYGGNYGGGSYGGNYGGGIIIIGDNGSGDNGSGDNGGEDNGCGGGCTTTCTTSCD
jgi:hypothetical protein